MHQRSAIAHPILRVACLLNLACAGVAPCASAEGSAKQQQGNVTTAPKLTISTEPDGATVRIDGKVFTRYLVRSGSRPVLWPINGPTGEPMTRAYPVGKSETPEETDHPHHRSFWFGYEGVNGCDYWHEPEADADRPFEVGEIIHRKFLRADSDGATAVIIARNDWANASGKPVCHDERTLKFGAASDRRWIDFDIAMWSPEGPLVIGDSKEGCFALRVATTMRVDEKQGGRIINSRGDTDADAWGRPAEWVDYSGPIDGETLGVAMMSHPDSFKPQPRWHVRTYGLFAANPFGNAAFEGEGAERARVELPEGQRLTLRYRVLLHRGDHETANVAEEYRRYAKEAR